MSETNAGSNQRFGVLDGWRTVSICLVIAAHLLPLGSKQLQLNSAAAATGMVFFFTLSGFLITYFLLQSPDVPTFLVRRFCRIVPLAWVYCFIVLGLTGVNLSTWAAHLLFYGNLPPVWLIGPTSHLWSLSLEMQFYVFISLLVFFLGRRGLWLLPPIGVAITIARIYTNTEISIVTWVRADEVLAGCTLALILDTYSHSTRRRSSWPAIVLAILVFAASHPMTGALNYARPYLSAVLIGTTLYCPNMLLAKLLAHPILAYVAQISYALYVIHGGLRYTWFGSGHGIEKYAKRPLYFAVLFLIAHFSTFYFEKWWIDFGKRWRQSHKSPGVTGDPSPTS